MESHALGRFFGHVGQAAKAGEIELHGGEQPAHFVVQFARDVGAFVFAGMDQVGGHFAHELGAP